MKLTFDDTVIPAEGKVFCNNRFMDWVRYNGVIVWEKDYSKNPPLNLTASEGRVREIFVDWSPPTNNIPDYYNLYRDGSLYKTKLTSSYYYDRGLTNGESHEYYATALFGQGGAFDESNPSNTDRGTTKVIAGSQTFTSDGVFTVPTGVTKLRLCMISGGNGGFARADNSSNSTHTWNSGGGKAGNLLEKIIDVYPGQQFNVTVGAGGRRSSSYGGSSGQGGRTTFGNYIINPSGHVYHWGDGGKSNTQTGCGKEMNRDGYKKNCTIKTASSGSKIFTSNSSWKAPTGVYSVSLCMVGGGGGGAHYARAWLAYSKYAGGGYAGQEVNTTVSVNPGTTYTITVGTGGKGIWYHESSANGGNGTYSKFGSVTANGGAGGKLGGGYQGNGGSRSGCAGTRYDGKNKSITTGLGATWTAWGGQASSFGNGGIGKLQDDYYQNGGTGAGGGGTIQSDATFSGDGGRGEVRISWSGNVNITTPYSYGGQGTIFGRGGNAGYSAMYGCGSYGLQAEDGQGYGAGGGGTYLNVTYLYNNVTRNSGAGKQGVCVVSWGSSVTGSNFVQTDSEGNITQDINPEEVTTDFRAPTGATITTTYDDTSNEVEITAETDYKEPEYSPTQGPVFMLSKLLGYDVLDEKFLNQRRYTTLQEMINKEKVEYISDKIDPESFFQRYPEGQFDTQNPEEK